jgi:sugar lactone lactonase YvrE
MPEPHTLMSGLVVGESPRWHEGRLWFSNWGAQEIVAVNARGDSKAEAPSAARRGRAVIVLAAIGY